MGKKRFSVDKAEWSAEREEFYREHCEDIAYQSGSVVVERDGKVYIDGDVLSEGKRKWYQAWLKFKGLPDLGYTGKYLYH